MMATIISTPRNALAAAYEAAHSLRTPTSNLNMLEIIDLLDTYSKRDPLDITRQQYEWLLHLLHDTPEQPGLVYVEHLMDTALRRLAVAA